MKIKDLFLSMLKVGCIGFGGGSALIPILHKTYVEEYEIVKETEYEEDVVVASITPGALTIKLAGEIGRRVAGWKGMLVGSSAMALPGVILTVLLLSVMTGLDAGFVRQVEFLTIGVTAYITCMLTDYVIKTVSGKQNVVEQRRATFMIALVFLLTCGKNLYRLIGVEVVPLFSLATLDIFIMTFFVILYVGSRIKSIRIVIAMVMCIVYVLCVSKRGFIQSDIIFLCVKVAMLLLSIYGLRNQTKVGSYKALKWKEVGKEIIIMTLAVFITLIPATLVSSNAILYTINGLLSSVMSFGGGDAYLTVADGLFVGTEIISEDAFYGTIVPTVNLLPGSILCKALSGIGYFVGYTQTGTIWGGCIVALVGFTCSFAASCGIVSIIGCLYRGFGELPIFQAVKQWIRPIVSGLMLNVILSLVYQSRSIGVEEGLSWKCVVVMFFIYGMNILMYYKNKTSNVKMVALSVVLSLVLCNLLVCM